MASTADDLLDEAHGHIAMGDLELAIPLLQQSTALDSQHFDSWQALAMTLYKLQRTQEAIGAGLMATTLRPNDLLAWTGLSQMFVQNGQIAEAEDAKGKARILSLGGRVIRES
jgi:Flp pilus assembly protein TadD